MELPLLSLIVAAILFAVATWQTKSLLAAGSFFLTLAFILARA